MAIDKKVLLHASNVDMICWKHMVMPVFAYSKVKPLRQAKGLNQAEIAAELGVSRPTYMLIEQGGKEPTLSQLYTLARLLGAEVGELCFNLPSFTSVTVDYAKFKEVVASSITHGADGGIVSKTKLALLVYLADFAWYHGHSRPMTSALYRSTPKGPVADDYFRALDDLYEGQTIAITPKGAGMTIQAMEQLPTKLLNEQELSLIHKIGARWRKEGTAAIASFVAQQAPSKAVKQGDPIPYEVILAEPTGTLY
jgi:putative transcriptional regulator